jgi:hypothetical protein
VKLQILTHGDFDGAASAALVLGYLRDHFSVTPDTVDLELVDYPAETRWRTQSIVPAGVLPIVCDFMYHPSTFMWFDHHPTTFTTPAYKTDFTNRTPGYSRWDPSYKSCAHLIFDQFRNTWLGQLKYTDLVQAADKIDSAGYESPVEYFDGTSPGLLLNRAWGELTDPRKHQVIRQLAAHGLEQTAPLYLCEARTVHDRNRDALHQYAEHSSMIGDVACVDLVGTQLPFLRYAPYYLDPSLRHALTIYKQNDREISLSLGRNPWLVFADDDQDLGAMASRYGGGGHAYVAGCTFPVDGSVYGQARQAQLQLARELASN